MNPRSIVFKKKCVSNSDTKCCVLYNPNDIVEMDSEVRCRIIHRTVAIREGLSMVDTRNLAFHKLTVVVTTGDYLELLFLASLLMVA